MSNPNQSPVSGGGNVKGKSSLPDVNEAAIVSNNTSFSIELDSQVLTEGPTVLNTPIPLNQPFTLQVGTQNAFAIDLMFNDVAELSVNSAGWSIKSQSGNNYTITNSKSKSEAIATVSLQLMDTGDQPVDYEIILVGTVPIGDPDDTDKQN